MKRSMILAVDDEFVIGNKGRLPWHNSDDMKWFREKTVGHAILFGATTADYFKEPLPKRDNYILTRQHPSKLEDKSLAGFMLCGNFDGFFFASEYDDHTEAVICGGDTLYTQAIDLVDTIYLTQIPGTHPGDIKLYSPIIRELAKLDKEGDIYNEWILESVIVGESCTFKTFQSTVERPKRCSK